MPSRPNIAFVTPEMSPLAKVGGLADVSASLPPALRAAGHDVRIFLPLYDVVARRGLDLVPVETAQQVGMTLAGRYLAFNLFERRPSGAPDEPLLYLIQCAPLFEREGKVYTEHDDEHVRWLFFQRAVIESLQRLQWAPRIMHLHDWTTALVPGLLQRKYAWDQLFADTRSVMTIHNLGYQGGFGAHVIDELDLHDMADLFDPSDVAAGGVNWLKTGLATVDRITTVSPTYAQEIQTPEHGHGLDGLLRSRGGSVVGILNGIDQDEWDPSRDRDLPVRYGRDDLWRRRRNKVELLQRVGLPADADTLLFGLIARLTSQKGVDLIEQVMPDFLSERPARLVVLGSGEVRYEQFFTDLAARFPSRVAYVKAFDDPLAHHIEGAADVFLMPSKYEPCGLNQMYSQRYGTLPLVHRTGGLADTVDPIVDGTGTGFVFDEYTGAALREALEAAVQLWQQPERWREAAERGMQREFGWGDRAERYSEVYAQLAG